MSVSRNIIISISSVIVAITLLSGCAHFTEVTYPTYLDLNNPPTIRVVANNEDKSTLAIALSLPTTNSVLTNLLPSKSLLQNEQGNHYSLEFTPIVAGGGQDLTAGRLWKWYDIRAYGPIPSQRKFILKTGTYKISIASNINGEEKVSESSFEIKRHSVPWVVVWFGWLFNPHGA